MLLKYFGAITYLFYYYVSQCYFKFVFIFITHYIILYTFHIHSSLIYLLLHLISYHFLQFLPFLDITITMSICNINFLLMSMHMLAANGHIAVISAYTINRIRNYCYSAHDRCFCLHIDITKGVDIECHCKLAS